MKIIKTDGAEYVIRLDRGDKWPDSFIAACSSAKLTGAFFYGLGAIEDPELAYYDLAKQEYITKKFEGKFEATNITGNISEFNESLIIHSHGTFAGPNYSAFGGHFVSGSIGGTLELCVTRVGGTMKRRVDPKTGLTILA